MVLCVHGNACGLVRFGDRIAVRVLSQRIDAMSDRELGGYLKSLCGKINLSKFRKSRRGPKKKVTKTYDPKVKHVSTFKILQERKNNKK